MRCGERDVKARRQREARFRQPDRRLEQRGPGQSAPFAMRELQRPQHAGRADRAPADLRRLERQRLARGIEEQVRGRARRRGLAAVVRRDVARARVERDDERPTPDARRLRLHEGQHHLRRNRGVDRAAALGEHRDPRLHRERVRRRDHVVRRDDKGLRRPSRRPLRGRCELRRRRRVGDSDARQDRDSHGASQGVRGRNQGCCHASGRCGSTSTEPSLAATRRRTGRIRLRLPRADPGRNVPPRTTASPSPAFSAAACSAPSLAHTRRAGTRCRGTPHRIRTLPRPGGQRPSMHPHFLPCRSRPP